MAFRRRLTVWERRKYKGLVYSQMREQVVDVVEDQILKLEAVECLQPWKLLDGREFKQYALKMVNVIFKYNSILKMAQTFLENDM